MIAGCLLAGPSINDQPLRLPGPVATIIKGHNVTIIKSRDAAQKEPISIKFVSEFGTIQSIYENVLIPMKIACDTGLCTDADIIDSVNAFFDRSNSVV